MFKRSLSLVRALCVLCLLLCSTLFWMIPVYCAILGKLFAPYAHARRRASALVAWLAQHWALTNVRLCDALLGIKWEIRLPSASLSAAGWYLVSANHQSWNDIYALVRVFGRITPFFKFLLKQELIWIPILGPVWWGLDYPFMKRYSRAQIARNPHLRGKDLETVRQACTGHPNQSLVIVNFLEGTRFTLEKQKEQKSPYRNLLKPKSGGLAFALAAMNGRLSSMIDVTIVYPDGAKSLWALLSGQIRHIIVEVRVLNVPDDLVTGDYLKDPAFRQRFQEWVISLWTEKDQQIDKLLGLRNRQAKPKSA